VRVLLGVTGSVAAVKTPDLVRQLLTLGCEVKVAATGPALCFFDSGLLPPGDPRGATDALTVDPLWVRGQNRYYVDQDEWPQGRRFQVGEPVLHIELRRWADLLLIAPLDANTLGKLALGLCDNLLTCVYRAWEPDRPVILAPAMNTRMWEHPATARHLRQLGEDFGGDLPLLRDPLALCAAIADACPRLRVVPPQSKRLACGDVGVGGMAAVEELATEVARWRTA